MADNRESMADLRRILAVREPLYKKADFVLETAGKSLSESFAELQEVVRKKDEDYDLPPNSSRNSAPIQNPLNAKVVRNKSENYDPSESEQKA